ncbi:hypothetical protein [Stenotrophomonas sp. PS02289]|uniref:hypothetical protein n=1 Tax=Stenotrophomonas sp. PS02289 TaxID=2991422 RepID=UPI00249B73A2|nr:hypothetical protein [Stenotrophomonas sp. PS02289]
MEMPTIPTIGSDAAITPPRSPSLSTHTSHTELPAGCTPTHVGNFYSDTLNRDWVRANAGVIKCAWRRFQQHVASTDQRNFAKQDRSTHPDYRALAYLPENVDRYPGRAMQEGRVFYCSPSRLPPLQYPMRVGGTPHRPLFGTFKRAVAWDARFMALEPRKPVTQPFPAGAPDPRLDRLRGIPSLVFNTVIHPTLAITRNAGTDLFLYACEGGRLPVSAFRSVITDLHRLHTLPGCGGVFLRDLKSENLCIPLPPGKPLPSGPLPPVRIIDFEQDVVFGDELASLQPAHFRGTRGYMTEGLIQGMYGGTASLRPAFARTADNYACMQAVMLLTARPGSTLQRCVAGVERIRWRGPLPPGIMRAANAHLFAPWLEQHVHPEHVESMRQLLTDPAKFAKEQTDPPSLMEMLRFQATERRSAVVAQESGH